METPLPFTPGDLIKTTPRPGYWGCVAVLSAFPATKTSWPSFHLGVTSLIFRRDYDAAELAGETLSILSLSDQVRIAPNTYVARAARPCIGIYGAKSARGITLVGRIDSRAPCVAVERGRVAGTDDDASGRRSPYEPRSGVRRVPVALRAGIRRRAAVARLRGNDL